MTSTQLWLYIQIPAPVSFWLFYTKLLFLSDSILKFPLVKSAQKIFLYPSCILVKSLWGFNRFHGYFLLSQESWSLDDDEDVETNDFMCHKGGSSADKTLVRELRCLFRAWGQVEKEACAVLPWCWPRTSPTRQGPTTSCPNHCLNKKLNLKYSGLFDIFSEIKYRNLTWKYQEFFYSNSNIGLLYFWQEEKYIGQRHMKT